MSLTTCAVRARVYRQDGTPDVGALVTATLNRFDVGDGFVGPSEVEAVVDANGVAILNLWPNELGATESTYKIRINGSHRTLNVTATVPNVPSIDLEDIATLPPYPGKQDGELAVEVAVEHAGIAMVQAGIATTQAGIATAQAGAATAQAGVAVDSAAAAAASEAMALAARPTTSVTPPENPLPNTEWIDEVTGRHYTWLAAEGVWAEMYAAQVVDNPARVSQLEAALGAEDGAGKVGNGGESVKDSLDALQLPDYAALRAYSGPRNSVYVTGVLGAAGPGGVSGLFVRDNTDTVSAEDGGTIIVASNGVRWKRRFDGMMNAQWFGVDPSYVKNSSPGFQAAILAGQWNGTSIYVPNGTYRDEDGIVVGTVDGNKNCYSVTLVGESTHGTVILRPKNKSSGPILTVSGFHNVIEKLTLISEKRDDNSGYAASVALYIRGNPQPGTNGNGTKYNAFRNLKIYRADIGVQIGNYDVDGVNPDIETNSFTAVSVSNCNIGWFFNGQNILHNPAYACHTVDCRDHLVLQRRGGDAWFERSYFGGLFDFLTGNYNVPSTSKILIEAGGFGMISSRSECWAPSTGNATPRFAVNVTSTDSRVHIIDNTFTTRGNLNTEPSLKLSGQGSGGNASVKATLINNTFGGYVEINTLDVFSMGNTYKGVASGGNGVVNGRLLSTNQKTQAFRDVFMDSNQTQEFNGVKFKRNSSTPLVIERPAVANSSEWQGYFWQDESSYNWGRSGLVAANATQGKESALYILSNRMNGAFSTVRIGAGTAAPNQGVWNTGDRISNSAPAVGSPKGWINTTAGGASSTTRADATAYASGVYAKWPTGTTVWECTTAGTSTTGAPDVTGKTVGQTVTDGTVTWTLRATTQANFVSEGNL